MGYEPRHLSAGYLPRFLAILSDVIVAMSSPHTCVSRSSQTQMAASAATSAAESSLGH